MQRLLEIMRRLRDPQNGCPWDRQQNFRTIAPYTIEEAYEVADAIERQAMDELRDELGDLLFQVVFHSQMAEEQGLFGFDDVVDAVCEKMERRHPHVFGLSEIENAEAQNEAWQRMKAEERRKNGAHSMMDGIPAGLAELQKSFKIQRRASETGFDWENPQPVFDKIAEELQELSEAVAGGNREAMSEELGDVLFSCTNLARLLKLDPAGALRGANQKFVHRFRRMEQQAGGAEAFKALDLDQQEDLWRQAKQAAAAEMN